MSRLYSLLFCASIGYVLGISLGRPGFGLMVGVLVSLLLPVGRLIQSSVATFFLALLLVVLVFPPLVAIVGLLLVVPLLLSWNLFSPGGKNSGEDRWFEFFGGSDPNKLMVKLLAGLVRVNDESTAEKTQTIRNFIMRNNRGVTGQFLWKTYKEALDQPVDAGKLAESIADVASSTQQAFCLQVLAEIATVDGELTDDEEEYIRDVAEPFHLSEAEVETILGGSRSRAGARSGGRNRRARGGRAGGRRRRGRGGRRRTTRSRSGSLRDAYETLDLSPSASKEKVKEAYQEKVKKHHPDRHQDDDDQSVEEAEEKMAEINQAYQRIQEQW